MPIAQQVLKCIKIESFKGMRDVSIDFTSNALTAILGPNGVGKSTVLHALACINNPVTSPYETVNHKLSEFFTPTSHSIWNGSSFIVYQDYRNGQDTFIDHQTHFRKVQTRWAPRYVTRLPRYVSFIGIRTCVPMIESETQQSRIQFNTTPLNDDISRKVRQLAGVVMNKTYLALNNLRTRSNKQYIGVEANGVTYSSLSMGAGEQRIFFILSEVLKAPRYGMILIDEVDLLLHEDALHRLLGLINGIATEKHLQIIFTTHAHSILDLSYINFRHLLQTPTKTLCFKDTKPDTLQRLTGKQGRSLEVFVEDDLANHLIKKIAAEAGIQRHVSIREYGAAINCFTALAGALLKNVTNKDRMLFVLDGDEYSTQEEKIDKIERVLTGDTPRYVQMRVQAITQVAQFNLPNGIRPEPFYHGIITRLDETTVSEEEQEIITVARAIVNVADTHNYLSDIIERLNFERNVGLSKLVDLVSKSPEWSNVKAQVSQWLQNEANALVEQEQPVEAEA
jgi:energy-coupling factor transporter ATP-binding protein EcfA2